MDVVLLKKMCDVLFQWQDCWIGRGALTKFDEFEQNYNVVRISKVESFRVKRNMQQNLVKWNGGGHESITQCEQIPWYAKMTQWCQEFNTFYI